MHLRQNDVKFRIIRYDERPVTSGSQTECRRYTEAVSVKY